MKAVVLHGLNDIHIEEYEEKQLLGPHDLRIAIKAVGICGSDVHYYTHGKIGDFVVSKPMVLGHEAAGVVIEIGDQVKRFSVGNRVCMEPGIPPRDSPIVREGFYNIDPELTFWATPPIDGCLRDTVIHSESFTYKLDDSVSFAEGAMVEPLAVGIQAAKKAEITPGDIALVYGAGTIGMTIALAALAGGCSRVIIADIKQGKLDIIRSYNGILPVNLKTENIAEIIDSETQSQGVDILFEATGSERVFEHLFEYLKPAGCVVLIGMPIEKVRFDVVGAQCKEATIRTVFRYANVYQKSLNLLAAKKIDLRPLISKRMKFEESIEAFELAAESRDDIVKIIIEI